MGLRKFVAALLLSAIVSVRSQISDRGCPENALTSTESSLQTALELAIAGNASADKLYPRAITLHSQHVVCLAAAEQQDEYSSASVVVSFDCNGSLPLESLLGSFCSANYTSQLDLECDNATLQWVPSTTTTGLQNFFEVAHATFNTTLDRFCSRCVDPTFTEQLLGAGDVDPETHCLNLSSGFGSGGFEIDNPRILTAPENQSVSLEVEVDPDDLQLTFSVVNVSFSCVATVTYNLSRPTITWTTDAFYNGFNIVEELLQAVVVRSLFTVIGVQPSTSIISVNCTAQDEFGVTTTTAWLTTLVIPFILADGAQNITSPEHTYVIIECVVYSLPQSAFTWLRNGLQLYEDGLDTHISNAVYASGSSTAQFYTAVSELTLINAKPDDSGNYTCLVSNGLEESAERHFQLTVQGGSCALAGYSGCCTEGNNCRGIPGTCYCDALCYSVDDCCIDIAHICNATGSTMVNEHYLSFLALGSTAEIDTVVLPSELDGSSEAIPITVPFPFGSTNLESVFVTTKAYITFQLADAIDIDFTPSLFPEELPFSVAPFWADIDTSSGGEIRYEVHTSASNTSFLATVSSFITAETESVFMGEWMLVAEWREVPLIDFVSAASNTFQAAVITDGVESYALFTYRCGSMDWSGGATIGFNANGTFFANHSFSGRARVNAIACVNYPTTVWSNLLYKISQDGPEVVAAPENQTVIFEVEDTLFMGDFAPVNVTFSCTASGITRPTVTWTVSENLTSSSAITVEEALGDLEIRSNLTLVDLLPSIAELGVSCRAENEAGVAEAMASLTTLCKIKV